METIKIVADNAGFFIPSSLGQGLAPNVFLRNNVNRDGTIVLLDDDWQSRESANYPNHGIRIISETLLPDMAQLGSTAEIEVTRIEYFRVENGQEVQIGYLEFPEPQMLTATFDTILPGQDGWKADLGFALEKLIITSGYEFIGGDGDDIFQPDATILPIMRGVAVDGGAGNDWLSGSVADDIIRGGTGNDRIDDMSGANMLIGNDGDDQITIGNNSTGSTAKGGVGDDILTSGRGDDFLFGNAGHDRLLGGSGADYLDGGSGSDFLSGGSGMDQLVGGLSDDILTGGEDADQFIFAQYNNGGDTITDFETGVDLLVMYGGYSFDQIEILSDTEHTTISWSGGEIYLLSVSPDMITADDFLFL